MLKKFILLLIIVLLTLYSAKTVAGQEGTPTGPVYIVQSGDTFYSIAIEFGITINDLVQANPDINPNFLSIGMEVVIPGLDGVRGRLVTEVIPLGETLQTLSIRNQVTQEQVVRLNRITSPSEVFAGASLIIPQSDEMQSPQNNFLLASGQSLFQLAAEKNLNPWLIAEVNQQARPASILPGEPIFEKTEVTSERPVLISPVITSLTVNPLPLRQGETAVVSITTTEPVSFSGSLAGWNLQFFSNGDNSYVALQGVHVMADPGIYPIIIQGTLADGSQISFEQMLVLRALGYIQEPIEGVDPGTIDPAVTKPEDEQIKAIVKPASPVKFWSQPFTSPGYDPNWITSTFGNRRSYNGSPFSYFHSGVDYGGGTGLPIKSPAPGIVVFAGPLTVRGNATILDHGWGVYSGFWHQSQIDVQVGDRVDSGQVIGLVGGTGRITGPHLHWEIWVNGVQVNPINWLTQPYP